MARLKGPLLSQEAHKKLAGVKVYQKRLTRHRVIKYSKPYQKNPAAPSPGQLDQRMIYNLIVTRWQTMTDGEKAPYIAAVNSDRLQMSPWNYFVKEARKDLYIHLGLCGYWSFNQIVNGKVPDLSGNGNDGTPEPSYPDNCPQLVPGIGGKFGQAMNFDGIDDHVNYGDDPSIKITGDITLEFWTYPRSVANDPDLLTKGNYDDSYSVWWETSRKIVFSLNYNLLKGNVFPLNTWYYVVCTRTGSVTKIYMNGKLDQEGTHAPAIIPTPNSLQFCTLEYSIDGITDEVRIYNRGLSQPEILKHYEIYSKYK